MQTLPYVVLTNQHLAHVYELYYKAFERFRKVHEVQTLDDNDRFCTILKEMLREHLTVIPRLAIGVLEVQGTMKPDATDKFMTTLLRSVWQVSVYIYSRLMLNLANITTCYCRTTSRAHGNLSFTLAFSRLGPITRSTRR